MTRNQQTAVDLTKYFFVDVKANVGHDGSSWNRAFKHLQDALASAEYGCEIRVAQGSYRPDRGAQGTYGLGQGMLGTVL